MKKGKHKDDDCNEMGHSQDTICCEPTPESLKNIFELTRRTDASAGPITTTRIDAPSPDFPLESFDTDVVVVEDTISKSAASNRGDKDKKHKTIYSSKHTFEYKNVLGWVLDRITLKPTIWTPGGCKITKAELYINSNLGIGAKWVKKNVKKKIFKKNSEKCQNNDGKMECAILEYDLEWEVAIRIGWLRVLRINTLTLQGFYQICADGTITSG